MNPSANKGTIGSDGAQRQNETKVETVDYRSSSGGQCQEYRPVDVIHQPHDSPEYSNTSGGVLTKAAASVASTLQSAKEAISKK